MGEVIPIRGGDWTPPAPAPIAAEPKRRRKPKPPARCRRTIDMFDWLAAQDRAASTEAA